MRLKYLSLEVVSKGEALDLLSLCATSQHSQRLASHGVETSPGKSGGTPQSTRADLSRRFGGFDVAPGGAPLEAESDLLRLRTALEPVLAAPGAHAPSLASR